MNLFFLDTDLDAAARAHADRHCVKMILETAQLVSTAIRELDVEDGVEMATRRERPEWFDEPMTAKRVRVG